VADLVEVKDKQGALEVLEVGLVMDQEEILDITLIKV
jgi:hypothetical protein